MKKIIALALLLILCFAISSLVVLVNAKASWVMWTGTCGGTENNYANCVVQTSDGGFVLAGKWLVKTDGLGNLEWNQTFEDADRFSSLVEVSDGGFVLAGDTRSYGAESADFWLVKTNESGNMEWNQTYGGADFDRAHSLVQTSDGGYALAGVTLSFGAGEYDVWLVKTDASGNREWNRTYGGEVNDRAYSLVETSDGGFALAGETDSFGAGGSDFWLIKTNEQGVPEFPSWTILPLFLMVTLFVIYFKKKMFYQHP
jgi:predicted secreted protein